MIRRQSNATPVTRLEGELMALNGLKVVYETAKCADFNRICMPVLRTVQKSNEEDREVRGR